MAYQLCNLNKIESYLLIHIIDQIHKLIQYHQHKLNILQIHQKYYYLNHYVIFLSQYFLSLILSVNVT